MLAVGGLRGNDALVAALKRSRLGEGVHGHGDVLPLVHGGPVADNDRRRVLVGHDNGRLGEPVPEGVRVIQRERLLEHAAVESVPLLELLGREGGALRQLIGVGVDRLGSSDVEAHGDRFAVLDESSAARSDARVLEHGVGSSDLSIMLVQVPGESEGKLLLDLRFKLSLLGELLFADGHF